MTRTLVSAVIVTVLFLQTIAGFGLLFGPFERPPYLYPFLDYPMYNRIVYEGEAVHRYALRGIRSDSSTVAIDYEELGLDFWLFLRGPVQAALDDDPEGLRPYARLYEERQGERLLAFQLIDAPVLIFADSLPEAEPYVVNTVWLAGAASVPGPTEAP